VIICIKGHGHGDAPDVIHPEELKYDHDERLERHSSARRIQNIIRSSSARKVMDKKRSSRGLIPTQDEHGHANPATIRLFTPTPLVHIHHHGNYSICSSVCSILGSIPRVLRVMFHWFQYSPLPVCFCFFHCKSCLLERTFFELFYDLIIVVVLMKLSFLKVMLPFLFSYCELVTIPA